MVEEILWRIKTMTGTDNNAWRELKSELAAHPWAVKFATWGVFFLALQAFFGCLAYVVKFVMLFI